MISYSYTSDSRPAHPPPPYTQSQPDGRVTLKVRKQYFSTYSGFLLLLSSSSPHSPNLCPYHIVIFSLIKLSSSHSHNYFHAMIVSPAQDSYVPPTKVKHVTPLYTNIPLHCIYNHQKNYFLPLSVPSSSPSPHIPLFY